ncbi:MAG: EF-hand domain-containing protein [Marinibacterium sp.]
MTRTLLLATVLAVPMALPLYAQPGQPGAHFVENWDLDENGSVSLDEVTERRGDVFLSFDADENGKLDDEEYAVFDQARANDMEGQQGHGHGAMVRAETGMHKDFNDANGDGYVSRDEFMSKSGEWFQMIDRNGDGVVTTADFGRK